MLENEVEDTQRKREVSIMKSISQLGSYIIPFSRREIRSPKGNFKGGKNKYTQNVLLPTPKKE